MKPMRLVASSMGVPPKGVHHIHDMVDGAKEVTYGAFRRAVGGEELDALAKGLSYATGYEKGLRLGQDWHVRYNRGQWKGKRCYFLVWSAIEYIFQ